MDMPPTVSMASWADPCGITQSIFEVSRLSPEKLQLSGTSQDDASMSIASAGFLDVEFLKGIIEACACYVHRI